MLIGVISDTHIPERADEIPKTVFEVFKNVDMILHAGDVVSITVIDQLKKLAPTICIQGNIDTILWLKSSEKKCYKGG